MAIQQIRPDQFDPALISECLDCLVVHFEDDPIEVADRDRTGKFAYPRMRGHWLV
jgi:hypothetical protein